MSAVSRTIRRVFSAAYRFWRSGMAGHSGSIAKIMLPPELGGLKLETAKQYGERRVVGVRAVTNLGRLMTAMVTPFDGSERVDFEQAKRLAKALLDSGSDGIVLAGTTGESPTLTKEEKLQLFGEVRSFLGDKACIVAGTGSYSTAESVDLTREAECRGVTAILAVVPYYNKPPMEGLYRHFCAIAEATTLPVILYNVPSRTSLNMDVATVVRLSKIRNIVGIKEASGNLEQAAQIMKEAQPGFLVWSGNDSDNFGIMALGGYGAVSVTSHLVGRQIRGVIDGVLEGRKDEAEAEHLRLVALNKGLFVVSNPIPVKWCLNQAGFDVGAPRLPLIEPEEETQTFLRDLMKDYAIDLPINEGR